MKTAVLKWMAQLNREDIPFKLVNFVHDEWQRKFQEIDRSLPTSAKRKPRPFASLAKN